ncbi:hypothetical protein PIB30_098433 [Stylosanthes scabra]|uniref:Uncharacterized protein n=1 Tax=Stylosanthes scabra TaxID=79078 RepID=A0ABU6TW92_9FABA|nr:hypothetical protein [Stylosanthes scabra]
MWLIKARPSSPKLPQVTFGPRFQCGPNMTNRTLEHHPQQATFGPSSRLAPNVALTQAQGLAPLKNFFLAAGPRPVRKSGVSLQISSDQCQGNRAKFSLRKGVTKVQPSLKIPSTGLGSFSLGSRNRGLLLIEKISGLVAIKSARLWVEILCVPMITADPRLDGLSLKGN